MKKEKDLLGEAYQAAGALPSTATTKTNAKAARKTKQRRLKRAHRANTDGHTSRHREGTPRPARSTGQTLKHTGLPRRNKASLRNDNFGTCSVALKGASP